MATFDRRRIPAPEISIPPIYEPEAGPSTKTKRVDRSDDDESPIFLKTGLISQANGSGYIEAGGVKIACSVYGPRPKAPPYTPQGTLNLEVKFAPFASDPRRAPLRDTEPIHLSQLLTQSLIPLIKLDLLPKSSIDIFLLVLESESESSVENVLSNGLTVASAAIADAGIEMFGLGVGNVITSSQKTDNQDQNQDQDDDEEHKNNENKILLGSIPALGKITNITLKGQFDLNQAVDMIEKAFSESKDTHTILAQSLLEGAQERGIGAEEE
ncbi:uncharacterized protein L201_001572 [Kwoniella dendrophila CBS 6074]|uniref:Exoribonuclease phosphorolytic domain-containing protein n=1 Tax=Kwoniella dendrophila CBS 6074 TaxID=1295534 RepID=A0AAX4JMP7_9TREE